MKNFIVVCVCLVIFGCTVSTKPDKAMADVTPQASVQKNDGCCAKNASGVLTCKLTVPELQQRKTTVLASLRKQMVEHKELGNGYAFKFKGLDTVIDELTEFIKTERQCCDFFTYDLSISGDGSEAWLKLTGPEGSKDFVTQELEL
jgi:hypothetical protein